MRRSDELIATLARKLAKLSREDLRALAVYVERPGFSRRLSKKLLELAGEDVAPEKPRAQTGSQRLEHRRALRDRELLRQMLKERWTRLHPTELERALRPVVRRHLNLAVGNSDALYLQLTDALERMSPKEQSAAIDKMLKRLSVSPSAYNELLRRLVTK